MSDIDGFTDDGWSKVADAFQTNFNQFGELGAAVAVYVEGRPVVDLWGGVADNLENRPWQRETLALAMSTTKGITAIVAHRLAERGDLDLDALVTDYWPEYGQNGKQNTKVRWLLTHQAGLPAIDGTITLDEACEWDPVMQILEKQAPLWEPGTAHAYHAFTYGYLVGEVVRRATGLTVGQLFAKEIAEPLGLDAWIGLPADKESRVARLVAAPPMTDPAMLALAEQFAGPDTVMGRALTLGGALADGLVTEDGGLNAPRARAAEFPAANLVSDARSIAKIYAATVGEVDGVRLLSAESVKRATQPQTTDSTPFGIPPGFEGFAMNFSLGFIPQSMFMPGLGTESFGHPGAGGSLGFADPESNVGFGYVMNQMAAGMGADPRTGGLIEAIRACL